MLKRLDIAAIAPTECSPVDLQLDTARGLAQQLEAGAIRYARFVGCRQGPRVEVIVLDVEVELVQHAKHDIRHVEQLAVCFTHNGAAAPEVLALREDFPANVPHLNLTAWEYPRSLCLYDVPFRDVRSQWTPARFVARIRDWLRLTARGELHAADQPLEPLLGNGAGFLILPRALREPNAMPVALTINRLDDHRGKIVLRAILSQDHSAANKPRYFGCVIRISPREFGPLRSAPETLGDLTAMLAQGGDDLLHSLREQVRVAGPSSALLDAKCIILILVPVMRAAGEPPVRTEAWPFLTGRTLRELGDALGVWGLEGGSPGLLIGGDAARTGADEAIKMLFPFFTVSRGDLAVFNGRDGVSETRITAVGAGSLGSQVILNAARAGFGRWTTIDEDLLLPHNLARHGLFNDAVGFAKALTIPHFANALSDDAPVHSGIEADILDLVTNTTEVTQSLNQADVIVDLSASVTVARALARDIQASARRVSLFLNPSGTDLTLLAEDDRRESTLDVLEMQYYRGLIRTIALENALQEPSARIRYGRSCRDVSVALSHARIAVHGGIAVKALEDALSSTHAVIRVWRADDLTLGVKAFELEASPPRACQSGAWTLVTDAWLLRRLTELRMAKLPNETGGVLIGSIDLTRRIVYVADTIPSPSDSHEYPTSYLRGSVGLSAEAIRIEELTMGQLHYIGEWHSHPKGSACLPSTDDANLFAWLRDKVEGDGLPPFIMIVGDDVAVPFFGEMVRDGSYPAVFRLSGS